jgi:putative membrane protein
MDDGEERQPARASASVKKSAERLARSAGVVESSADRRTELAADRTVLAAERTYAAWVRTGLGALASGVGAKALFAHVLPGWFGALTGSMLILFSAFCFVAAVWRELRPHAAPPEPETRRMPAPVLLALNGWLVVVAAAALVGIWIARA